MNKMILSQYSVDELTDSITEKLLMKYNEQKSFQTPPNSKKEFLTREEVAEMCNVKALSTLWNWSKQGILVPMAKAGRKPLYRYEDVINFLNGKKGGSYATV
ncbi:helix-turn-helix domain-containing protein [Arenibacter sp. S6351L]|uniref:helix-turn-helix domain-containing protein n=1 Tax=Arenibacter sp. S6351L TaxID=2926407 RepID=UPI001FF376C0|nr:helix-turn-helix domain-containing protein [Arenibacter sp. S6351L]MCK0134912.1 helix-turn-helix domain-containing protein [Arenibacter sp. S6351L]